MASVCDTDGVTSCKAEASESMSDEREFTVAGRDFKIPEFSPVRRRRSTKTKKLRPFSVPVVAVVAPELDELDLESTLVAGESFLSSDSRSEARERNFTGDFSLTKTTSYVRAVTGGRMEPLMSTSQQQSRGKKQSVVHSVMSRFRSSSNASSMADVSDPKNLSSAKMLKRELLGLEGAGNDLDLSGLLFTIMGRQYKKEKKRPKMLATLLTYSCVNINERAPNGMTALHYAVQDCDLDSTKILIAFGANINATNQDGKTPLELLQPDTEDHLLTVSSSAGASGGTPSPEHSSAKPKRHFTRQSKRAACTKCVEILRSMGAVGMELAQRVAAVPNVPMFPQVPSSSPSLSHHRKLYMEVLDWEAQITSHYSELERNIHSRLNNTSMAGREAIFSPDAAISLAAQLQEMSLFQKSGSRILCLDGGGIKGLVQLETLCQLEKRTGRRIVELFDWIVGTSSGGIIALGLVYAKKSLSELRQLYFKLKDEVFGKTKGGMSFNTVGLERILKEEFSESKCMDDETYPRVLISAVKKDHINLKLHFFNNCFNDELCRHMPVWKVARYTCAAPVLFGESDQYVDGGVLANNPSDSGLSKIQSFFRSRGEKLPLSLVVSVGSGKYPSQTLGNVDFLFVGSQGWSSLAGTSHLMELLSYALVEPSVADDNCRSRCEEQGVRYFRLNPRMEEVVGSGETDVETLISMILQTRKELEGRPEFSNLVLCLHELSHASNRMHSRLNGDYYSSDSSTGSV